MCQLSQCWRLTPQKHQIPWILTLVPFGWAWVGHRANLEVAAKIKLLSQIVINLYQVVHRQQLLLTHALRGNNNKYLPTFWRSNQETETMKQLLLEWFNYFGYEHEEYLKFKVPLVQNTPRATAKSWSRLPKTTTSLLQPLNQGIITAFKVYYTCHTFHSILGVSVMENVLVSLNAEGCTAQPTAQLVYKGPLIRSSTKLNGCW